MAVVATITATTTPRSEAQSLVIARDIKIQNVCTNYLVGGKVDSVTKFSFFSKGLQIPPS